MTTIKGGNGKKSKSMNDRLKNFDNSGGGGDDYK